MKPIDPSQARYREAIALTRLGEALGIQLRPEEETYSCLERLAAQAERLMRLSGILESATRLKLEAYREGYGSDRVEKHEGES